LPQSYLRIPQLLTPRENKSDVSQATAAAHRWLACSPPEQRRSTMRGYLLVIALVIGLLGAYVALLPLAA
jgi:hypothetical protein